MSHETIYRSLFIQTRGVLKKELLQHLRTRRTMRRPKHASQKGQGHGQIPNAVSIRERPASVEDRAVPGHWEGDLIEGSNRSYIATLVERHSRYLMLAKVSGKDTETVVSALIKQSKKLPSELYKSLTWDRGKELTAHQRFTLATDIKVYFCDPSSPWQRGSNENTNRLLRQYFPRGTDLSVRSQTKLSAVARQLNERPRKTLDYETPAERFNACVFADRYQSAPVFSDTVDFRFPADSIQMRHFLATQHQRQRARLAHRTHLCERIRAIQRHAEEELQCKTGSNPKHPASAHLW